MWQKANEENIISLPESNLSKRLVICGYYWEHCFISGSAAHIVSVQLLDSDIVAPHSQTVIKTNVALS